MKKRNKTAKCLNCGIQLPEEFEFCPKCGQENNDTQITFRQLIGEFFSNYFSFDSRFGRSVKPFFLKPGHLTYEFMIGKRASYANPIRLYLVVSLLHFFILSIYSADESGNTQNAKIFSGIDQDSTVNTDSILTEMGLDSLQKIDPKEDQKEEKFILTEDEWSALIEMGNSTLSEQEIQDSLKVDTLPFFQRHIVRQFIRIQKSNMNSVNAYLLKNIPILMFFLLPIYALILKLFFSRKLYINHIIHSLHLHSYLFVILSLFWLIQLGFGDLPGFIDGGIFLLLSSYTLLSFKKVYEIKTAAAFWRMLGSASLYSILIIIGLIIEVFISLLLF